MASHYLQGKALITWHDMKTLLLSDLSFPFSIALCLATENSTLLSLNTWYSCMLLSLLKKYLLHKLFIKPVLFSLFFGCWSLMHLARPNWNVHCPVDKRCLLHLSQILKRVFLWCFNKTHRIELSVITCQSPN